MAVIQLYRIETMCGLCWTGGGFSYEPADAEPYDTEDDAYAEIEALGLQDVFVERVGRYSAVPQTKLYDATEARAA